MVALAHRDTLTIPLAALAAVVFGALVGLSPVMAGALAGGAAIVAMAFLFPVAHLAVLLMVTALVPFEVLNANSFPGGAGSAGVTLADVVFVTGLARAAFVLFRDRLARGELALLLAVTAFMGLVTLQFVQGVLNGANVSTAGTEFRILLTMGTALIALAIVREPRRHRTLLIALLVCGLVAGVLGLAQWFLGLSFTGTGDFGVREGVALTSGGTGQLQGGLFSYPVICILAFSALVASQLRGPVARAAVLAVLAMNTLCLLLTFERTMWVVTILGCFVVAVRAERVQRARLVLVAPVLLALGLGVLAVVTPSTLTTARERLLSIGQYGSDFSVEYRIRESGFVIREIEQAPLAGSGLGATIYWGIPRFYVPAREESYSHNGYLWAVWKLGLPGALLLLALFVVPMLRRRGPPETTFDLVVIGAQASLLAYLIANITFPTVSGLTSMPTTGLLVGMCLAPALIRRGT